MAEETLLKRILPHSIEAEQSVVGSMIMDREAIVAASEIVLGEDEYFVLGDNRNNSEDSRFSSVGNVKRSNIIGKVWLKVTSLNDISLVK